MPPLTITTTPELVAYLASKNIPYTTLTLLTGGTANFVWRATLPTTPPSTIIIKHAEPFIASNPSMAFPPARMAFEARALTALPPLLKDLATPDMDLDLDPTATLDPATPTPPTLPVRPVPLLAHDAANHILHLADGGPRTLKAAYADPAVSPPAAGAALGRWLACLHARTTALDVGDNAVAKTMYRHSYRGVAGALEAFGQARSVGERVDAEFGALLAGDDGVVCHGDFWPGNVLVGEEGQRGPVLTVVDWEMVRRGCGATDIGQFAAEAWLLDRFRGGRGLLRAFLAGYAAVTGPLERAFVRRVAVHWGVHVAYWPTMVEWGTRAETAELVKVGLKVIELAMDEDWEGLAESELFQGSGDVWKGV